MPFQECRSKTSWVLPEWLAAAKRERLFIKQKKKLMWLRRIIANQRKACHAVNDVTRMGAKSVRYER
ncbi:hypothetical protein WP3W18C02_06490 [Klebsiella quasipneumoniae]|nr:hypothetical protein WP3W18C02_06490 [Klebsiella quasipneumoniae]BBR13390.1 hypothetical protein WP3S18E03_06480 [Klebsiella quasipneumoniae]